MSYNKNILDHYGRIHASFLHAYGETGTEKLLRLVNFGKGESVLEIGFGTGATLVKIASANKHLKLYGIECSETMLNKAKARIKFSGFSRNIFLEKVKPMQQFPFKNNSFDKILIESVLAIQDNPTLHFMLSEIRRVLKLSGKLYLNETVWLSSVTHEEIERINTYCKNKFGIIQSNAICKYRNEWKHLLETNGFIVLELNSIKNIELKSSEKRFNLNQFLSKIYSFLGKIRSKLITGLKRESLFYKEAMRNVFEDKQYLEGIIIVASKNEE